MKIRRNIQYVYHESSVKKTCCFIIHKYWGKNYIKCLTQEFDNNDIDLNKKKRFDPYEYMSDFEKFKEQPPNKEMFYNSLTSQKISDKDYEHVLKVWNKFEIKTMKEYLDLYIKFHVLLFS